MGAVFRKTFTKPLPAGAEIITRKGQRFAKWRDAKGKLRTESVTTGNDGQDRLLVTAGTFTAKYRDGQGIVREVSTGCRDETAAKAVLADMERQAERVRSGLLTAAEAATVNHQDLRLLDHVDAYLTSLEADGTTSEHRANVRRALHRISKECSFGRLGQLNRDPLEAWLVARAREGMGARTRNTYRSAAVAFCNWCVDTGRLLVNPLAKVSKANEETDVRRKRRALTEDEIGRLLYVATWRPLAEYGRETIRKDKQDAHGRKSWKRAPLELEHIDAAVARARERLSENPAFAAELERRGRERGLVYKTAVLTGLRRGELASITVGQICLDVDPAYLILEAADEKSRDGANIPLQADLADDLRGWLAEMVAERQNDASEAFGVRFDQNAAKAPKPHRSDSARRKGHSCQERTGLPSDTPLFHVPRQLFRILDRDLRAAGIPKVDDRGRKIDVHALRHSFGTLLSKAGVTPRTAQEAMRHSTIDLTMNVYTDPRLLDVAGAVEMLPAFSLSGPAAGYAKRVVATGTNDRLAGTLAPTLAPATDNLVQAGSFPVKAIDKLDDLEPDEAFVVSLNPVKRKQPLSHRDNGCHQERAKGLEPSTSSLGNGLGTTPKSQEILGFPTVLAYFSDFVGNCKPVQIDAFRRVFGGKRADKW